MGGINISQGTYKASHGDFQLSLKTFVQFLYALAL